MIRNYLICETLTNYHILRYLTDCNNCFIIRLPILFSYLNHPLTAQGGDLPFFTAESRTVDLITDEPYYLQAVFCRSRDSLSANGEEENLHRMISKLISVFHASVLLLILNLVITLLK